MFATAVVRRYVKHNEVDTMQNLLETKKQYGSNLAQAMGGGLVGMMVALLIAIVIDIAVVIPVTNDVITSASLTGTTATVVGIIPVLVALLPIVVVAAFLR